MCGTRRVDSFRAADAPQGPGSGVLDLSRGKSRVTRNGTEPVFGYVPLRPLTRNHREKNSKQQPTSRVQTKQRRRKRRRKTTRHREDSQRRQRRRREEGTEPVFERSGESGGYTFTDLHYPRFVPPPASLPLRLMSPHYLPLRETDTHPGSPPAHKLSRYTRARCTRHRHDPQNDTRRPLLVLSSSSYTASHLLPRSAAVFYSKIMSRRHARENKGFPRHAGIR